MKIGWALDIIGWACAQPFPTLAMPLVEAREWATQLMIVSKAKGQLRVCGDNKVTIN